MYPTLYSNLCTLFFNQQSKLLTKLNTNRLNIFIQNSIA